MGNTVQQRPRHSRVSARHAIFAFAPLAAAYLAAAERITLGLSLNLLWLLLTAAAVMHCLDQHVSRAARTRQLLALALVLTLFFPIISLNDDQALAEVPPDLQSLVSPPAKQKVAHSAPAIEAPPPTTTPQFIAVLYVASERTSPVRAAIDQCVWREASGNHSPPAA